MGGEVAVFGERDGRFDRVDIGEFANWADGVGGRGGGGVEGSRAVVVVGRDVAGHR